MDSCYLPKKIQNRLLVFQQDVLIEINGFLFLFRISKPLIKRTRFCAVFALQCE